MDWWLDDAEKRSREAPDSFFIPPLERRVALEPGRAVKLIFMIDPPVEGTNAERMWVEVKEQRGGGYVGELLNDPSVIAALRAGDDVSFEPRHVAAMLFSDDELGYRVGDYALVSPYLPIGSPHPEFVLRKPPAERESETDSGWRLVTQADYDAPAADEPRWFDLGWLADRFPELEALFRARDETGHWRWDGERYVPA
jgi:hypothetical protein